MPYAARPVSPLGASAIPDTGPCVQQRGSCCHLEFLELAVLDRHRCMWLLPYFLVEPNRRQSALSHVCTADGDGLANQTFSNESPARPLPFLMRSSNSPTALQMLSTASFHIPDALQMLPRHPTRLPRHPTLLPRIPPLPRHPTVTSPY